VLVAAVLATAAYVVRASWLPTIGTPLAVEDPVAPVDAIVVSNAIARADTLTAAALYHDGVSTHIVLPWWQPEPLDLEIQALGVPWLPPTDLAIAILEKKGVPRTAVEVLKDPVDGLNAEVASVGRWAQARRPQSLMFVTARSHSRRARWLLERVVPAGTKIVVRSSTSDPFDPHAWWQSRAGGREVAMEYLRWVNTFVLHDPWGTAIPVVPEAPR
jgi:uncharacterized SAM-binding protein YcdF (DUF218 family)